MMKKTKKLPLIIGGVALLAAGAAAIIAADHVDSPAVASTTSDIADFYAFQGNNVDNTVFIATLQGPLDAGTATADAAFDENVLVQINIDNNNDFVEDLVIQAIRRGSKMYFFGPVAPSQTGLISGIETTGSQANVDISTGSTPITASANGMTYFAGARRDAFYFDFAQFNAVATGMAAPNGFLPPADASDFFIDKNVLAIVIEVPNSLLGTPPAHVATTLMIPGVLSTLPDAHNVWVTTKRKQ